MNRTIEELKLENQIKDGMIDALECIMNRQRNYYMSAKMDPDTGELVRDDNGDLVYEIPDADTSEFAYFTGYQRVIDAVYKMLK